MRRRLKEVQRDTLPVSLVIPTVATIFVSGEAAENRKEKIYGRRVSVRLNLDRQLPDSYTQSELSRECKIRDVVAAVTGLDPDYSKYQISYEARPQFSMSGADKDLVKSYIWLTFFIRAERPSLIVSTEEAYRSLNLDAVLPKVVEAVWAEVERAKAALEKKDNQEFALRILAHIHGEAAKKGQALVAKRIEALKEEGRQHAIGMISVVYQETEAEVMSKYPDCAREVMGIVLANLDNKKVRETYLDMSEHRMFGIQAPISISDLTIPSPPVSSAA